MKRNKINLCLFLVFQFNMCMFITIFMVFALSCAAMEALKPEIIGKVTQCVLDTLPPDILSGGDLFKNSFMMNISLQWDPLNPHDYLMWPVVDGTEAWVASCHFSRTIKLCLTPLEQSGIKIDSPPLTDEDINVIVPAFYFLRFCEYQYTLTDPRTNNAECVHQRILSDDVLRCLGLLSWYRGNPFLILNVFVGDKWTSNAASSVYECIYDRGNWRHSCRSKVEAMMLNLTKSFSSLAKINSAMAFDITMLGNNICDVCKPGSDLTIYDKLNKLRVNLLRLLFV